MELIAQSLPTTRRLMQLPGVGPLIATTIIATVGDAARFKNGRQMSVSISITPAQHSSGGKARLLGISKRGDAYLRTLLIHGARSAMRTAKYKTDRLSRSVTGLGEHGHANVAVAALANKTIRIAWAMMQNQTEYQPDFVLS